MAVDPSKEGDAYDGNFNAVYGRIRGDVVCRCVDHTHRYPHKNH